MIFPMPTCAIAWPAATQMQRWRRQPPGSAHVRIPLLLLALAGAASAQTARAQTPAFDRPGISFSTTTLPPGSVAWEQGLPDFERDRSNGVRTTRYSASTNLRLGLTEWLELQVANAPFNYLETRGNGMRASAHGAGDLGLALKAALPAAEGAFSWAAMAGVSLDTGSRAFTAGTDEYTLGVTLGYDLSDCIGAALLLQASEADGQRGYLWSPGIGFAIDERWSAFLEAGFASGDGPDTRVAGGGVTWMATPTVQLDASLDFGLNDNASDLQGGIGVSVYFD